MTYITSLFLLLNISDLLETTRGSIIARIPTMNDTRMVTEKSLGIILRKDMIGRITLPPRGGQYNVSGPRILIRLRNGNEDPSPTIGQEIIVSGDRPHLKRGRRLGK